MRTSLTSRAGYSSRPRRLAHRVAHVVVVLGHQVGLALVQVDGARMHPERRGVRADLLQRAVLVGRVQDGEASPSASRRLTSCAG